MTTANVVEIKVRCSTGAYIASAPGGLRASSTTGADWAARVLARKVFPDRDTTAEFVRKDGDVEVWRIAT